MQLFYKKYGKSGDPIFILHGVFGMLDNWHNIAGKLSHHYCVYTVDQRNHGHSPHAPSMSYSEMADDLAELMDSLHIPKAHIIGHSMGGKTAMKFAAMHPDRVWSLIVADIAPKAYRGGHLELMDALERIDFSKVAKRKDAEDQLAPFIDNQSIRLFLLKNLDLKADGTYGLKLNLPAIRQNYDAIIGELSFDWPFSGPALFMKGEHSRYITTEDENEILNHFPEAEFVTIPGAGHWLHAENPTGFMQAVNTFLNSLPRSG